MKNPGTTKTRRWQTRSNLGLLLNKYLCTWCMKPEDEKHRGRGIWHIFQKMDAWDAFKNDAMYLEDVSMKEWLLTFIRSTPYPLAAEIHYHRSCWRMNVINNLSTGQEDQTLHINHVQLSEV